MAKIFGYAILGLSKLGLECLIIKQMYAHTYIVCFKYVPCNSYCVYLAHIDNE